MLKRGFSLMEMMIVMLIVAVVAAASAPMINKKMLQDQANDSPWVWTGADNSIAYNLKGNATQTAVIGAIKAPQKAVDNKSKLHVESDSAQITLQKKNSTKDPFHIIAQNQAISISNITNNADKTVAIGYDAKSTKENAVAVGYDVNAAQSSAIAIGDCVDVTQNYGIGIGEDVSVNATYGIAIGSENWANATNAIVMGREAGVNTEADAGISIGRLSRASGPYSVAVGKSARALNTTYSTIAIGNTAIAKMKHSIAIGDNANVGEANSGVSGRAICIGYHANATESDCIAIGGKYGAMKTTASGMASIAIGSTSVASGENAIAIGGTSESTINVDTGTGTHTQAANDNAIAIGADTVVDGVNAIALGAGSWAEGGSSIAIGAGSKTGESAGGAIAIGYGAKVYSDCDNSIAIGNGAIAHTSNLIVLGTNKSTVYIPGSLVVGKNSVHGADDGVVYLEVDDDGDDPWEVGANGAIGFKRESEYSKPSWLTSHPHYGLSDRRLKNVGEAFKGGLAEIKKLEVFNYTFKEDKDKTPRVGVMAQDLQKIFPKAVFKGEDGFLRIRMEDMFYALMNAVKELDAKINLLEQKQKRIDELEKEVKELKKQNIDVIKRLEKLERGK